VVAEAGRFMLRRSASKACERPDRFVNAF